MGSHTPREDPSLPKVTWPKNSADKVDRWVESQEAVSAEHCRQMTVKGCKTGYSSIQEWPFFPGPIEGYPPLEEIPFFGKMYSPILVDQGARYCSMFAKGDAPYGMDKCALRFTDDHPLVQWIQASLNRTDINA